MLFPWKLNRYSYGVQFWINCTALDQSKLNNFAECTIMVIITLIIMIAMILILIVLLKMMMMMMMMLILITGLLQFSVPPNSMDQFALPYKVYVLVIQKTHDFTVIIN